MSLKNTITEEIRDSLKQGEKERVSARRLLLAAIKQKEIDTRLQLDDSEIVKIINKLAKQRKESISQYQAAGRMDLVKKEQFELNLLSGYLPSQLNEKELEQFIDETLDQSNLKTKEEMGKLMGILASKLKGKADLALVNKILRGKLA